ncbi:MAG: caspase family protein [Bacteroidetes bacterium]|nr:caspase family protein [Bacteroidota bacterium]
MPRLLTFLSLLYLLFYPQLKAQTPILHLPTGHSERITQLLPSKNNTYLVSFSRSDGKVIVSHTAYRKMLYEIADPSAVYLRVYVNQDSNQVIVAGVERTDGKGFMEFFDIRNGKSIKKIRGLRIGERRLPVFSEDYRYFVAPGEKGQVGVYDTRRWRVQWLSNVTIRKNDWYLYERVYFSVFQNLQDTGVPWVITSIDEKGTYVSDGNTGQLRYYFDSLESFNHNQISIGTDHFLIYSEKSSRVSGPSYGSARKRILHLEKNRVLFDEVCNRIYLEDEGRSFWYYDTLNAIQFHQIVQRDDGFAIVPDGQLDSVFAQRQVTRYGFDLIGFLTNPSHVLFRDQDTLMYYDRDRDSLHQLLWCDNMDESWITHSTDGDEWFFAQCELDSGSTFYAFQFEPGSGYTHGEMPTGLSDGIWLKQENVWISKHEKTIEYDYLDSNVRTKREVLDGRVVGGKESTFLGERETNNPAEWLFVLGDDGVVRFYNCTAGTFVRSFRTSFGMQKIEHAATSLDGKLLITSSDSFGMYSSRHSCLEVWDVLTGKLRSRKVVYRNFVDDANFSPDASKVYFVQDEELGIWDLRTDQVTMDDGVWRRYRIKVNATDEYLIIEDRYGFDLWSTDSLVQVASIPNFGSREVIFNPTGNKILVADYSNLNEYIIDDDTLRKIAKYSYYTDTLANGRTNFVSGHEQNIVKFTYSPDEKWIVSAGLDGRLICWDTKTQKIIQNREVGIGRISGLSISPDNQRIVSSSEDQRIRIWDRESLNHLATIVLLKNDASITLTPESYYYATGDVGQYVSWQVGDKFLSFEQLDVKYNRPDRVLESLHSTDTNLIMAYRMAYAKRLERMEYGTVRFDQENSPPRVVVSSSAFKDYLVEKEHITIHLHAEDLSAHLASFNVWMNGVPIFGTKGVDLSKRCLQSFDTTLLIVLIDGVNKIEVAAFNNFGLESLREPVYVRKKEGAGQKPKLYFVGIAVDDYVQEKNNLRFSAKDIRDLVKALTKRYPDGLVIDTLLNERVTRSAIDSIFSRLKFAQPNDKLIMSYSGHGLLSETYDYYLSTHDLDFAHPERKGYAYDQLEQQLGQIPIRRKLLLIDACHSGEVDKGSLLTLNERMEAAGLKGAKSVVTRNDLAHLGLQNSFDLMNELFLKVGNETGTTIISAAAGTQFALENDRFSNGIFTWSVLELLQQNEEVTISELQNWVKTRVPELTSGIQQPTSRSVNFSLDWGF